ncbi:MAG: hypothetical protein NC489_40045 [Ruminococcus flavefaciens]|nr:hypothetical protein [Ruminococcus flavefaciens]
MSRCLERRSTELIYNVGQETAAGSEHAIGHVGRELPAWFGKLSESFI